MKSYIMRISIIRDQLLRVEEVVLDRELVVMTLRGLPPIWETFITTIRNTNLLPSFHEIVGKLTQEESRMIGRRKGKEVHQIQESLLLKIPVEERNM